jgi:hypothetical protein
LLGEILELVERAAQVLSTSGHGRHSLKTFTSAR